MVCNGKVVVISGNSGNIEPDITGVCIPLLATLVIGHYGIFDETMVNGHNSRVGGAYEWHITITHCLFQLHVGAFYCNFSSNTCTN